MGAPMEKLFLPGWGAAGSLYRPGLPADWTAVDLPSFRRGCGLFANYRQWLIDELDRRAQPVALAGHSMGAALAIAAAAARPDRVASLLLISPAGLPLTKPIGRSLAEFASQAARGTYPLAEAARSVGAALQAPRLALRLARAVHDCDLSVEMAAVRGMGVETTVVACASDTLVTTDHCRRATRLLGASYRELPVDGGHMWMLRHGPRFVGLLDGSA